MVISDIGDVQPGRLGVNCRDSLAALRVGGNVEPHQARCRMKALRHLRPAAAGQEVELIFTGVYLGYVLEALISSSSQPLTNHCAPVNKALKRA